MRRSGLAVLLPAAALAACGQTPRQPQVVEQGAAGKVWPGAPPARPAAAPAATATASAAAASPPLLVAEAERGEKGARNILLEFARLIEMKRFGDASALLGPAGAKWTGQALAQAFAGMGTLTVAVGDGAMEGAAGSSYYTAPVVVTGADRDGRPVRIAGNAVVRRVNDVPGASAAQLRWHFETLKLAWEH